MTRSILTGLSRKSFFLLPFFFGIAVYSMHHVEANSLGITGRAPYGCSTGPGCHSPQASASTTVTISTQATQFVVGKTYTFQIMVKNRLATQKGAGCDIVADSGTLSVIAGSGLRTDQFTPDLTHSTPKLFNGGDSAVWSFKYTAPDHACFDTIRAAGNAVNMSGENDNGDLWNLTTFGINVVESTGAVSESGNQLTTITVYPNPSSGKLTVSATNLHGNAETQISDATGKGLMNRSINLDENSSLDLSAFSNGLYFLRLTDRNQHSFVRTLEIKK